MGHDVRRAAPRARHRGRRLPRRLPRTVVVVVLLALVAGLTLSLSASPAAAHAELVASQPAVDATVARSPARILLGFSEPVDPGLSKVQVVDARGRPVAGTAAVQPVNGNPQQLQVVLARPLAPGVYTVAWRSVSAVDGHVAGGEYAFGVGVAHVGAVAPFGKFISTATWLTTVSAVGRWLLFAGLALLLGAASTCWLVLRGRLPGGGPLLLRSAWLLAAVGVSTIVLSERAIVRAPSLLPLFETHEGLLLLGLAAAVLVFCGAAVAAVSVAPRAVTFALLGATAMAAMFVVVWTGHANDPSPWRVFNLADQWLHVVAVGVWVGGLPWLLLGSRGPKGVERSAVVRRFSRIAGGALAVVVLTGLSRAVAEVGAAGNLIHTSFGRTLLVKLALFCVLLALAGLTHFILVPTLGGGAVGLETFRRTVLGEVVLGVAILAVTGLLSGQAPARLVAGATQAATADRGVLVGAANPAAARARQGATSVVVPFSSTARSPGGR